MPIPGTQHVDVAQRVASGIPLHTILTEVERQAIGAALQQCSFNRDRAADQLGLSRQELDAKIRDYNIATNGEASPENSG
jgi:DNA-binding NtrC family response regulator